MVALDIAFTPEAENRIDRLRNFSTSYKIPLAIARGMDNAMPNVIGQIKSTRLSGKGPFPPSQNRLGEVTGLLKSSLSPIKSRMEVTGTDAEISGGFKSSGCPYVRVHEFGYSGQQNVRAHNRTHTTTRTVSRRGGRLLKRPVVTSTATAIKAYSRNMNIPERAPLRTGLRENLPDVIRSINTELAKAIENI